MKNFFFLLLSFVLIFFLFECKKSSTEIKPIENKIEMSVEESTDIELKTEQKNEVKMEIEGSEKEEDTKVKKLTEIIEDLKNPNK